jgi:hypothetical protein
MLVASSVALALGAALSHNKTHHRIARYADGPWINLQTVLAPALGVYHTTQEILDEVDHLSQNCKANMKVETMSNSTDGKWPLRVVSLGEGDEKKGKILLLFGIHGREYLSAEISLTFMRGLCDGSSAASKVLAGASFTIVPVLNPSGRDYVRAGGHSCADMRKNGAGVDLNRNFDVSWKDGSDVSAAEDYRGHAPFSERESQLVKKLVDEGKPHMFIDVHTGDLSMLMPWNDREEGPPAAELEAMTKLLEHAKSGVTWFDGKPDVGVGALTGTPAYLASGTTGDYAYLAGVKYPFIWETYRLDEFRQQSRVRRQSKHMDAVQWSDSRRQLLPKAGKKPHKALELLTTGPLMPATTSLTPATMAVSPTNVPAEFISDDCFKFFNPVSTESLTQYTAQWKMALMRASQYLSDEHLNA